MDTIASILRKKYALIFVHGYYMILEARKTVRILEQVMSSVRREIMLKNMSIQT